VESDHAARKPTFVISRPGNVQDAARTRLQTAKNSIELKQSVTNVACGSLVIQTEFNSGKPAILFRSNSYLFKQSHKESVCNSSSIIALEFRLRFINLLPT
jgi:hypothetical protein